jgi:hypothetical protein
MTTPPELPASHINEDAAAAEPSRKFVVSEEVMQVFRLIATLALVVLMFALYHLYLVPKPTKFAVLDLNFIVEAKQMQFTAMLAKPGVVDADREAALELVKNMEGQLKTALDEYRAECQCEVLVKAAALTSGGMPDITTQIAQKMGITSDSLSQAKAQVRQSIESIAKPK